MITIDDVRDAISEVLIDNISVGEIDDSGVVDYSIDSKYFPGYTWSNEAYSYKYKIIDRIIEEIINKLK